MIEQKTSMSFRELCEWASDERRFNAAIDSVIAKMDSGELPLEDLPPILRIARTNPEEQSSEE